MITKYFIISALLLPILSFAQNQQQLTANQIVDASIAFCGGETRLSKISTGRINYQLILPDQPTAIINEQIRTGKKYTQCILSTSHIPQTTFFNGEKVSRVSGDSITHITDVQAREEIKLKTYTQIQYGYKQLKYQLTRLPDQKFKNFDCFVVNAKADNGYTTMNFFDKTNFRLLMIAYPSGNKSLLIDYVFKDSVLFNSQILNTYANSAETQTLKLRNLDINPAISDVWFTCPYADKIELPQYIKTGKFTSSNGADTRFTRTDKFMDYTDAAGKTILRRLLFWLTADGFALIDEKAAQDNNKAMQPSILVRVISWDENGYVCQWITDTQTDTQDYKLVK